MNRVKVGKNFVNASGTNTVVEIIAPSTNTQGVILRTICFACGPFPSGVGQATLYVDTSAPSGPGPADKRIVALLRASTNAASLVLDHEIEVPAGLGVWLGSQLNTGVELTWDFIDA